MNKVNCLIALFIAIFICNTYLCFGQTRTIKADSVSLDFYYRFSKDLLERDFKSNLKSFESLDILLSDSSIVSKIDSIAIIGVATPEGPTFVNQKLSVARAGSLQAYITWKYSYLDKDKIWTSNVVENWTLFRKMVIQNKLIPHKEELLSIMNSNIGFDEKEQQIKEIDSGKLWRYLEMYVFSQMRIGAIFTMYYKNNSPELVQSELPEFNTTDTIKIKEELEIAYQDTTTSSLTTSKEYIETSIRKPLFSIKTNLLYDIALTPNLEFELPIKDRWSINAEVMCGWWLKKHTRAWQIQAAGIEARYWFGDRKKRRVLTGWFVGGFASAGFYDFQLESKKGVQGDVYIIAGFSGGYALPLSENLSFEFSGGVGYFVSDYQKYTVVNNEYLLKDGEEQRFQSVFPAKLKVSLAWTIYGKNKK